MQDFNRKNYLLLEQYEHVHARHLRALDYCTAYKQFEFQQACKRLGKSLFVSIGEINVNINKAMQRLSKCTK